MVVACVLVVAVIGVLGPLADGGVLDRLPWTVSRTAWKDEQR